MEVYISSTSKRVHWREFLIDIYRHQLAIKTRNRVCLCIEHDIICIAGAMELMKEYLLRQSPKFQTNFMGSGRFSFREA